MSNIKKEIAKFFLYGVVIIICWMFFAPRSCNRNPELPIDPITNQPIDTIRINDSLKIYKQLLYQANSRAQLINQDSIIAEAIKSGKIKPETVISWKIDIESKQRSILLEDSLGKAYSELQASIDNLKIHEGLSQEQKAQFEKDKEKLLATRISFKDSSKYRILEGDFGFDRKFNITKDIIKSEPYVIIGEKNKFLGLGSTEYTVAVGDKNPDIRTTDMFSATYKPKSKVQMSFGPMILSNGKNISGGVGAFFKRGIISVGVGYQFK